MHNDRCPEISFTGHKNPENKQKGSILQTSTDLTIPLKFGLGTIARLL